MSARNIVVLVDGSDYSKKALEWTFDNMYKEGDKIHLLFSHYSPATALNQYDDENVMADALIDPLNIIPLDGIVSKEEREKMLNESKEEAKKVLLPYIQMCEAKKCAFQAHVRETVNVKECIMAALDELKAHVCVCGNRGLGMVKRMVLGSVSDYVIHHAKVPTMVVRHE
eukprot:Nk52_evm38s2506 gene=Nk52_evmTU38s2506